MTKQEQHDYFYSMVRTQVKQKRKCLSRVAKNCKGSFLSDNAGNRICSVCRVQKEAMGAIAEL